VDPILQELRNKLDAVDRRLVANLAERDHLISEVGKLKLERHGVLRDLKREEDLLTRLVAEACAAGLDAHYVARLFREILDHSVRKQQEAFVAHANPTARGSQPPIVVYLGEEGSYSHQAARHHFESRGGPVDFRGGASYEELLQAVRDGVADFAMLPIENTTAGSSNEAYDLLARMDLALVGEEVQKVEHCLVALEDVPLSCIKRVYSSSKAIDQCTEYLRSLTHCHVESMVDTASAARKVRDDQDLSQAAIASEEAARIYELKLLKHGIANQKENFTRYVVVARTPLRIDVRIPCKTSILFATRHEEGALMSCLNVLGRHHVNLTKLESRPRPHAPWEYQFYVDFEGNVAESRVQQALQELAGDTSYLKVFGSYPARTTRESRSAEPRFPQAVAPKDAPAPLSQPIVKELEKKPYRLASRTARVRDSQFKVGDVVIGGPQPIIIAGPCFVESREQILGCARLVKELGGHLLRGGCVRPLLPAPLGGEGLGVRGVFEALELLEEAGRMYGLPIVTEVMHPDDLGLVAKKADVLQIGARNMQNLALLKEVGRIDRPVLLERGMMASIDEWLQAAEYLLEQGNQQVILCEGGIRTFETATRNTLDLSAVPVIREFSHLPIMVDPSHACGTARWVPAMAEAALASGAHGVMIDIHPEAAREMSEATQGLGGDGFRKLMQRLLRGR
jgi:chorismate mutase/prephenate dehydratase